VVRVIFKEEEEFLSSRGITKPCLAAARHGCESYAPSQPSAPADMRARIAGGVPKIVKKTYTFKGTFVIRDGLTQQFIPYIMHHIMQEYTERHE
jgi:hypothetical protein